MNSGLRKVVIDTNRLWMIGVSLMLFCYVSTSVFAQNVKCKSKSRKEIRLEKQTKVFEIVDTYPEFPGGDEACNKFIFSNLVLPDTLRTKAPYVKVLVSFIVEKDGRLTDVKILPGSFKQLANALKGIFEMMPKWKAGSHKGYPRRVHYSYRVVIPTGIASSDGVLSVVDKMPTFPGGELALQMFLNSNIDYPVEARDNGIQGKVYVTFIIETDGSLSDIKIAEGLGYACDEECIRIVRLMPHWIPAENNGVAVRVQITLPITFLLQ